MQGRQLLFTFLFDSSSVVLRVVFQRISATPRPKLGC